MSSVASATSGRALKIDRTRSFLALVASLTAVVLIATAGSQIFDSNLLALPEATAILAGDHPYRDFFEWGAPLAVYLSAAAQVIVGYRMIGEFLLQWGFIVAGVVVAFHLGLRLSRSIAASMAVLPLMLIILAQTPTYHYSKLFFLPVMVSLAWRYMDRPGMTRSVVFGITSAVAFLFRHDYGVYALVAFVAAVALAPRATDASRVRSIVRDVSACAAAAAVLVVPWAIVVQLNEGLIDYVHTRLDMYEKTENAVVYVSLLALNPIRAASPRPTPPARPAMVSFFWADGVDEAMRHGLERRFGLRASGKKDAEGRPQYEVANVYDTGLFELDPYINDGAGFQWNRLKEMRWHLPARENVVQWVEQMILLIPVLLLVSGAVSLWRHRSDADRLDGRRVLLAGLFLVVVDSCLLRQPTYLVIVAPLTLAMSGMFLAGKTRLRRGCAFGTLLFTTAAAIVWARESLLFRPADVVRSISGTFAHMLESPPVGDVPWVRYLHDCTAPGDRLLVTGMNPFQFNYYAQRPMAGGHLYWRRGWRSDPVHETQSLALLRRQSVPIVVSTRRHVLDDFKRFYPQVHAYLLENYAEVQGSGGTLLVDTRRHPTGRFGPNGFPCFR